MLTEEKANQLDEIVVRLLGRKPETLQFGDEPIDVKRPNIHDNKKEFQKELSAVETVVANVTEILDLLINPYDKNKEDHSKMVGGLRVAIDQSAFTNSRRKVAETTTDLAVKNVAETGFYNNSLYVLMNMLTAYNQRHRELKDQEQQFWSVSHRPPHYYARTIALRLARLYAKELQKLPTIGTARDGGHPSTDYGRALEEVFKILVIKASVPNAGKWALAQLKDEDLNPVGNVFSKGLLGALLRLGPPTVDQNVFTTGVPTSKGR